MPAANTLTPLLWFIAIICMIPMALWLLKRSPMVGGSVMGQRVMKHIATLPLSPNQRVVAVEVGHGDERRWLVLGITAQQITTLHTMNPQDELLSPAAGHAAAPFAQMLGRLRQSKDASH